MVKGQDFTIDDIRDLIAAREGVEKIPARFKVVTDTSDFFRIDYNDVVLLGGRPYWVKRYEKEGRFGIDDQPKYWVRRAVDLLDGSTKILKLVFHEEFNCKLGELVIRCFRSPGKEARILDLVAGHKNFMHGTSVEDAAGNNVRILEFIRGRRLDDIVFSFDNSHRDYFLKQFPDFLNQYIEMVNAIRFLHQHGEKHGDIRRDHIIWDRENLTNRWIDFDYNYMHGESMFGFDLQGLGNILIFLVGRGDVLVSDLHRSNRPLFDTLWGEDLNLSFKNRVANLQKIYPYIPNSLNRILLHFSWGATIFYENVDQMLDDLDEARKDVFNLAGRKI